MRKRLIDILQLIDLVLRADVFRLVDVEHGEDAGEEEPDGGVGEVPADAYSVQERG